MLVQCRKHEYHNSYDMWVIKGTQHCSTVPWTKSIQGYVISAWETPLTQVLTKQWHWLALRERSRLRCRLHAVHQRLGSHCHHLQTCLPHEALLTLSPELTCLWQDVYLWGCPSHCLRLSPVCSLSLYPPASGERNICSWEGDIGRSWIMTSLRSLHYLIPSCKSFTSDGLRKRA